MSMKVLFLDIDGVLNNRETFKTKSLYQALEPDLIQRINTVVSATKCHIVISSSWRIAHSLDDLKQLLTSSGLLDVVIGVTPRLDKREQEICQWLLDNPEVKQYAIVDDDVEDLQNVIDYVVQTSIDTGILDQQVKQLINLLSTPL